MKTQPSQLKASHWVPGPGGHPRDAPAPRDPAGVAMAYMSM